MVSTVSSSRRMTKSALSPSRCRLGVAVRWMVAPLGLDQVLALRLQVVSPSSSKAAWVVAAGSVAAWVVSGVSFLPQAFRASAQSSSMAIVRLIRFRFILFPPFSSVREFTVRSLYSICFHFATVL